MHYPIQYESMEAAPQSQSPAPRPAKAGQRGWLSWGGGEGASPAKRGVLAVYAVLAAGLGLRLWLLGELFQVNGDSQIYGGIAKNLLQHGRYALNGAGSEIYPTLIRLPGYPLFLAGCFGLFGMENYWAATVVQIALDVAGCLLLADFARRIAPAAWANRAAMATLCLAALCPFTASYAAAPLTETPTLFMIALALWAVGRFAQRPGWMDALLFTAAVSAAALLRPDGALIGVALAPAMALGAVRHRQDETKKGRSRLLPMAAVCILLALLPFALWAGRNWKVFHVFQPLAPRYATEPGEDTHPGWIRWIRSWCTDFSCTYEFYWPAPGAALNPELLPASAFDSAQQKQETEALVREYNDGGLELTPAIDARFAQLAAERERAHPLRTRIGLPLKRMADMWLRPRIENLPIDLDWRNYGNHNAETLFSWAYVALNLGFIVLAAGGMLLRTRFWPWMLLYFFLRSALLCTVEAPEARYTLECFPMLFVLGGVFLAHCEDWSTKSRAG